MKRLVIPLFLVLVAAGCSGDDSADPSTTTTSEGSTTTTSAQPATTTGDQTTTSTNAATSTTTGGATTTIQESSATTLGPGGISVTITSPADLTQLFSTFDSTANDYVVEIELTASVIGEGVTVSWESDIDGDLGQSESLQATVTTGGQDVANHTITATATDASGNQASDVVRIQVSLPSG